MISALISYLKEPSSTQYDVDSVEFTENQLITLKSKKMMKDVFSHFYEEIIKLDKQFFLREGKCIELGAGTSFLKEFQPNIITSDIKRLPWLDAEIDAMDMPFDKDELKAIYGINCFHHFPNPEKFFEELLVKVKSGGGCILIEPYYSPLATFIYKRIFQTEHFNKKDPNWVRKDSAAMLGANQALSYIVFKRDIKLFQEKFPTLEIVYSKPIKNWLQYLLSGGLNFKQLIPNKMLPIVKLIEFLMKPILPFLGLHQIIVLRKK